MATASLPPSPGPIAALVPAVTCMADISHHPDSRRRPPQTWMVICLLGNLFGRVAPVRAEPAPLTRTRPAARPQADPGTVWNGGTGAGCERSSHVVETASQEEGTCQARSEPRASTAVLSSCRAVTGTGR